MNADLADNPSKSGPQGRTDEVDERFEVIEGEVVPGPEDWSSLGVDLAVGQEEAGSSSSGLAEPTTRLSRAGCKTLDVSAVVLVLLDQPSGIGGEGEPVDHVAQLGGQL